MNKEKELNSKQKQELANRFSQNLHDFCGALIPFTLYPALLKNGELLSDTEQKISRNAIAKVKNIEEAINQSLEKYSEMTQDKSLDDYQKELNSLFKQFYAATVVFLEEKQPQKKAGELGDHIISLLTTMRDCLEKVFGVKSVVNNQTVDKMAALVGRMKRARNK